MARQFHLVAAVRNYNITAFKIIYITTAYCKYDNVYVYVLQ